MSFGFFSTLLNWANEALQIGFSYTHQTSSTRFVCNFSVQESRKEAERHSHLTFVSDENHKKKFLEGWQKRSEHFFIPVLLYTDLAAARVKYNLNYKLNWEFISISFGFILLIKVRDQISNCLIKDKSEKCKLAGSNTHSEIKSWKEMKGAQWKIWYLSMQSQRNITFLNSSLSQYLLTFWILLSIGCTCKH